MHMIGIPLTRSVLVRVQLPALFRPNDLCLKANWPLRESQDNAGKSVRPKKVMIIVTVAFLCSDSGFTVHCNE